MSQSRINLSKIELKQRVITIDTHANKIWSEGGDEALLLSMHSIMDELKQIMVNYTC